VADLRLTGFGTVVEAAAGNETPADTAPESHIENGIEVASGAVKGFAERSGVGVVLNHSGEAGEILEPTAEREIRPALNLVGTTD
jgi:hypothetical protein